MKLLIANLIKLREKLKEDWDVCIVIHGNKRKSKSTLALQIAEIMQPGFKYEDMSFDLEHLKYRSEYAEPGSVVLGDETIRALHKGDWNSPEQKDFEGVFFNIGDRNLTMILVTQVFEELPRWMRKAIDIKIYIPERGKCVVRLRQEGEFIKEPYFRFLFNDTFNALTPKEYTLYKAVKREKLKDAWGGDNARDKYIRKAKAEGMNVKSLCRVFSVGKSRVYEILKTK